MQPVDGQWDAPMQSTFSTPMHPPSHFHLEGVQQSTDRCSLYFVFIITFLRFSFKSIFFYLYTFGLYANAANPIRAYFFSVLVFGKP